MYDSKTNNRNDLKVYIDDISSWLNNGYGIGFYETGANNRKYVFVLLYVNGEQASDIIIPSSITNLGEYALAGVKMNSLTLHKSVDRMHVNSLYYNTVKNLYMQSKFAPDIWLFNSYYNTITTNSTGFTSPIALSAIYVPSGKSTTYKNKWTNHAAIIKEADLTVIGEQTATTISEIKSAYTAVTGNDVTYMDLSGSTLDESLTAETLKDGDTNSNIIYYLPSGSNIEGDNIVVDGVAANVALTDGNPVYIPMEFTANNVNNTRSIAQSEANAYTLCLPYNYTLPAGLKAYVMNSKDSYGNIVFVEAESIVANEPYLIVANSNIDNLNASNVLIKETPDEMEDKGVADFVFRGTLQKIPNQEAADMGTFILQANKEWHPVSTNKPSVYIAAGRAYIIPPTGAFSRDMIGSSLIDDSYTGIKTISKDGTEQYYDLYGRRIDKPTKGLYIKNGKKTIIK